eukprot:TRINITY_DN2214_c0_g1_i2.p1 TRINITY_DN2214_c0_g1~~TRINITY_DN2214_c0_g1_i2.p1  ORF type:complete len:458 (+),score=123.70 TRINITY_DN2214_c0_g1_i2:35-1408(+)
MDNPELNTLTAISPVDGRYWKNSASLSKYFSEFALISYRCRVEIEYFIFLVEIPLPPLASFPRELFPVLRSWYEEFSLEDARKVKDEEKITNHDIKAVEYFLKKKFAEKNLEKYSEFIHFALTSQDVNNTAIPLSIKDFVINFYLPSIDKLVVSPLSQLAAKWMEVPMLAHTHGQPATPTRVGKELRVFVERLKKQLALLSSIPFSAKFGGATGQFNAHAVAFPSIYWPEVADAFVSRLGLERQQFTTQIEHYDMLAALFDNLRRINVILIDLCRDIWTYISLDYFTQKVEKNEVGSSAMPHKVNPIDFENAEGNLGVANALLEHLSHKLPISRLQRDLTDSTVLRNVGVPLSHSAVSFNAIQRGLNKLQLNESSISKDLDNNWAVVAEAIQTVLRREGYPAPYEALKDLTRTGKKIDHQILIDFIDKLQGVNPGVKEELKVISPFNYTGQLPSISK